MYVDIIITAVVVLFAVVGMKKGFAKSVISFLSLAAALVLAWILRPVAADLLSAAGLKEMFLGFITKQMPFSGNTAMQSLPQFITNAANGAINEVGGKLADMAVNIIAFVCVLLIARLVIYAVSGLLKVVPNMPVVGFVNRFLGFLLGAMKGILIVSVAVLVLCLVFPTQSGNMVYNEMSKSYILQKANIENDIIKNFVKTDWNNSENGSYVDGK